MGSRRRTSLEDLIATEAAFLAAYEDGDIIVSGGCPTGGDRFAEIIAKKHQIPILIHYAKWNKLGRSAGFIRNGDIAEDSDILIAVLADTPGGADDTVEKFGNKGKVILV